MCKIMAPFNRWPSNKDGKLKKKSVVRMNILSNGCLNFNLEKHNVREALFMRG